MQIKYFIVLIFILLISGCAMYSKERRELDEAYQSGRITTDQYMAALSVINQQQMAQTQMWRGAFSQAAENYKQSAPKPLYNDSPKQYDVYDQNGQQIGTAREHKSFLSTVEEMEKAGLRPK